MMMRISKLCLYLALVGALLGAAVPVQAYEADAEEYIDTGPIPKFTGTGFAFDLPIYHLGFELITEGTINYTISRKMRNIFPLDLDLTVFFVWGYTGDKLILRIQDVGDQGDRIFAIALSCMQGETIPKWGTLYSSSAQNSFEITLPMFPPGAIVYLLSGFFTPSKGVDAYAYNITVSFPQ